MPRGAKQKSNVITFPTPEPEVPKVTNDEGFIETIARSYPGSKMIPIYEGWKIVNAEGRAIFRIYQVSE